MKREVLKKIAKTVSCGEAAYLEVSSDEKRYVRKFLPKERLIVLGGGHISQPLCHIASLIDFDVTVVDDRPSFANYERFPDVKQVICGAFRETIRQLQINAHDYVCVVTRGHRWDGDCLREILSGTHPSYLGMIGSRRRVKSLYDVLEEEGFDRTVLETIHSPIGTPIHAVTPAEISVSICGELIEHRRTHMKEETKTVLEQTNVDSRMLDFLLEEEPRAMMLVLGTKGSTPAPAGAMMAIDPIGRSFGTIGGGCSEAEVIGLARRIAQNGGSRTALIDMTNDAAAEEGMACGGTMEVLIEAIED